MIPSKLMLPDKVNSQIDFHCV